MKRLLSIQKRVFIALWSLEVYKVREAKDSSGIPFNAEQLLWQMGEAWVELFNTLRHI